MHEEWTDKLSDYLDGELTAGEAQAVEAHLRGCAACAAVLDDLQRVVARARELDARPPQADLWPGIAARTERIAQPQQPTLLGAVLSPPTGRRVALTLPQLAAAAVLLMAVSGTAAWQIAGRVERRRPVSPVAVAAPPAQPSPADSTPEVDAVPVNFADAQYDAAVVDLEKALKQGRGRLDKGTIDIVEHNLQIIDQAIAQARDALGADPANTYLSGHLVEARRRKLDLLRRAAALAESN